MNYQDGRFAAEVEVAKYNFNLGYICKMIGSFGDEPENAYQRGYLKRLLQLADYALKILPTTDLSEPQTMTTLVIPLVGSHFYPPAKLLLQSLAGGTELVLDPEPTNPHDSDAVRVLLPSESIPEEFIGESSREVELLGFGISLEDLRSQPTIMLGHLRRERDLQTTPGNISALALMSGCPEWTATLGFDLHGKPTVKLQTSESAA